jgi:hypothetical protein
MHQKRALILVAPHASSLKLYQVGEPVMACQEKKKETSLNISSFRTLRQKILVKVCCMIRTLQHVGNLRQDGGGGGDGVAV